MTGARKGGMAGRRDALLGAAVTLAAGAVLSTAGAYWQERYNATRADERLAAAGMAVTALIAQRMAIYEYGLRGMRGMVLAIGQDTLRWENVERYARTRDLATEFPGARGFGLMRRVAAGAAAGAAFERTLREEGLALGGLHGLGRNDGERFVIQYIAPLQRNRAALGLDIASEPHRRAAALAAMDTGTAQLSAPVTLVQETGKPLQSFLLLLPVYNGVEAPRTVQQRRRQLTGWVYAPLVTEEIMRSLPRFATELSFGLSDITGPGIAQVIVPLSAQEGASGHRYRRVLAVHGRRWEITFRAQPAFFAEQQTITPGMVLAGGLGVTCLAAGLAGALAANQRRRREDGANRAHLAAIVENSGDAILGKTLDGVVTSWNHGAELLFGYSAAEAVGKTIAELIVPADRHAEEVSILQRLAHGEAIPHFETMRLRKDRSAVQVSVTASPIRDAAGHVVGASKTVRDISARKAIEALAERAYKEMANAMSDRTAQLRQLDILLTSILGSLELAIIATDDGGTITVFNRGAERLLGYAANELAGRAMQLLLSGMPDDETMPGHGELHAWQRLAQAADESEHQAHDWKLWHKEGHQVPVSIAISALRDEAGRLTGYLSIAMDATRLRHAQSALQRQHAELLALRDHLLLAADVARLGVWSWLFEESGPVWNEHMHAIYGIPARAGHAGPTIDEWFSLIHPDDEAAARASLDAAIAGEREQDMMLRVVRPDGSLRYLQTAARAEYDRQGRMRRITGINLDVTERMELVNTLQDAKARADAASEAKSKFLANMSHEIRTPLNAVLGMLQILQNSGLTSEQSGYAANAATAAHLLLGLLNDILDYSKIEAGKLALDTHPFDLELLLRELAVVLSATQGAKELEVIFDIDAGLPATLVGDRMRLLQVLVNLAGNALKFTERGEVILAVTRVEQRAAGVLVRFSVTDTGIGIAEHQKNAIFEGFTQAEASISRRFGGTGLGLVICRRLVDMMGAELHLHSQPGCGSRFWFDVEFATGPSPPTLQANIAMQAFHLLVVDDNPQAAALLVRMVGSLGWRVASAPGGAQAIAAVTASLQADDPFDVVLMDWSMPGMNGCEAAERIAQLSSAYSPPVVIMVTAYGRDALAGLRGTGRFVADLLTKPATPALIAESVTRALGHAPRPAQGSMPPPLRLAGMRILVVEDDALNRQVAQILLKQQGAAVALAENGEQGVAAVVAGNAAFDAVLMDMQMPVMDGLEATRLIRADPHGAAVRIIAMTANASSTDRDLCMAAGMDAHLAKPIDVELLVDCLLSGGEDANGMVEPIEDILRRFGGALDIYRKMLEQLPAQAGELIDKAASQLAGQDAANAAATLHALKGTAATFGAADLSLRAGALESRLRCTPWLATLAEVATLHGHLVAAVDALARQLDGR